MKKNLLALALLTLTSGAYADSAAEKANLVNKFLRLQQPAIESMGRTLIEQPVAQMSLQVSVALQQRIPADRREALAKDIRADIQKFVSETSPVMRDKAVSLAPSTIGAVLTEKMSEDELKQLVNMMESPAFRKYQQLSGEMQQSMMQKLLAEARVVAEPKLKALEKSIADRFEKEAPSRNRAAKKPAEKAPQ